MHSLVVYKLCTPSFLVVSVQISEGSLISGVKRCTNVTWDSNSSIKSVLIISDSVLIREVPLYAAVILDVMITLQAASSISVHAINTHTTVYTCMWHTQLHIPSDRQYWRHS